MYKIIVNENPATGACPVLDHFNEHWTNNDKLHPIAKGAEILINEAANEDSIVVTYNGQEIIKQKNGDALRLDILQASILAYDKAR